MWFAKHWYIFAVIAALLPLVLVVLAWRHMSSVFQLQNEVSNRVMGVERAERVLRTGEPAVGTVLDSHDTGTRTARIFILVQIKFHVQPESGLPAFETELVAPISPVKLPEFSPGRSVKLRVDPASREIAIDQPTR